MGRLLFFLFFICISNMALCQTFYPYQDIKLEKPADYKAMEPLALSTARSLLSNPFLADDINRIRGIEFLSNWASGTRTCQFYMKGKVEEISEDRELLGLYLAAMVKFTLENRIEAANPLVVEKNACRLVLAYCDNPANNFKLKKKTRKLLEK
ncbi:MAG: hypothetical protein ABI666_08845 [Ferruginibacter sp.]